MGSIFGDPVTTRPRASKRQLQYLSSKKTDRKKSVKHEEALQIEACEWLRQNFPNVHFRSDTGSGAFNSKYAKNTHNKQQSSDSLPDLIIFSAQRGYHGLMLELKADGINLKKKRDGTKIIIRKDAQGRIVERDYKIRMRGDWSNLHIEKQAKRIEELKAAGYCATFSVGIEQFKKIVSWYFKVPYIEDQSMF